MIFKKVNRKKMLIAIVAVVVFLSALLLCLIRQENKEQVQLFQQEEIKKELVETAKYLEQIDDIVLRNHSGSLRFQWANAEFHGYIG